MALAGGIVVALGLLMIGTMMEKRFIGIEEQLTRIADAMEKE